ncbi:hypothetical protein PG984_005814 [Apiospora sp. TS-2023a]
MVSDGCNLLLDACWHGRFEAALTLLRHGADARDTSGLFTTPLRACCIKDTKPRRDYEPWAVRKVTNWPEVPNQGFFSIDRGPGYSDLRKWECSRAVVVQKLVDAGADMEDTSNGESTPLLLASRSCLAPVVSTLLKAGASVQARDSSGHNALLAALETESDLSKPRLDTVSYLLEACCDARRTAEHGEESVLRAIGCSLSNFMFGQDIWDDAALRRLLERGADARARTYGAIQAFHLFSETRNYTLGYAVCQMLTEHGALEELAKEELCAVIKHHFMNGPSSGERGNKERTAVVETLLEIYAKRFVPNWPPSLEALPSVKYSALVKEVLETVCQDCNPTGFSTQFAWLVAKLRGGVEIRGGTEVRVAQFDWTMVSMVNEECCTLM